MAAWGPYVLTDVQGWGLGGVGGAVRGLMCVCVCV